MNDESLPKLWVSHCPFRKTGSPVLGCSGASIREIVMMELPTWNKLLEEHPSLRDAKFLVGEDV